MPVPPTRKRKRAKPGTHTSESHVTFVTRHLQITLQPSLFGRDHGGQYV